MKYILSFIPLLCLTFSISGQDSGKLPFNHGQRIPSSFESMADGFLNPDMIYAPFMFWFWDEPLQPEKMKNMAGRMIEQGINPGYVHPRRSMNQSPGLPDEEWLGDVWFESFGAVTRKAKEENAYVGYVDEYWWPSLRAHGRVLEANPS
ncbi:MAG: hypothetical protein IH594_11355, partial [Bacteroidales bacterium]|nr:hypothetical protein [Bacteroidales bacterium]